MLIIVLSARSWNGSRERLYTEIVKDQHAATKATK